MRIFVTGGTGFIGKHFLSELKRTNYRAVCLKRNTSHVEQIGSEVWLEKSMDQLEKKDFMDIDVLVHFASPGVSPREASYRELIYWNVLTLEQMLRTAAEAGVKRFILAGSFAEYGLVANQYEFIPSDAALLPTTAYATSKAASSIIAHQIAIEYKLELGYFRIFSVYGEGQYEKNFWPALRSAAYSGEDFSMSPGEQIRDYIDVTSIAKLFIKAIEDPSFKPGEPLFLNMGSGIPISMCAFAKYYWDKWQASGTLKIGNIPYRDNEVMRFVPSKDSIYI